MKSKAMVFSGAILSGVLILPAAGQAVAAGQAEDMYSLGKVVVTRPGNEGVQASETMHTVTAEQIRQENARTLDEALQLLPGISVRTGGDGIPRIDIRGFRTRHVQLLLNGTPFNASYDGQFDPSLISVENIAEIQVITGGGSVLYGPGGNGGTINIITKKGKTGVHGAVSGEAAENSSTLVKGSVSGGTEQADYFVSGSSYKRDSFPLSGDFTATSAENGGSRDNSDLRRGNAFANVSYAPTDATQLGLTVSYLKGDQGKPPVVNFNKNDPFSSPLKFERENDSENLAVQLAASHDLTTSLHLKGWAFFNQLNLLEDRYDNNRYTTQLLKGSSRTDSSTQISGVNAQLGYDLPGKSSLTVGLMAENDDWSADGFQQVQASSRAPVTRSFFNNSNDFQLYSTVLEYQALFGDRFGVVLGTGYHWQDRENDKKDDYSYLAGAHYDLATQTRLKVNHARKIRFPSLKDLYDPNGGNPNLVAETSKHYEAGIEQGLPVKTRVSFTVFHDDIDNFIEKDVDNISKNFNTYVFNGFEVVLENKAVDNLTLRASYSYLDTEDKSPGSLRDQLQYRPRDKVTFEANYRFAWGTTVYGSVMYLANQYFYDSNQIGKRSLPDYTLVDLKVSQDLYQSWNVYLGVRNLFDENYVQSYGLPQAGRTLYTGLEYRF